MAIRKGLIEEIKSSMKEHKEKLKNDPKYRKEYEEESATFGKWLDQHSMGDDEKPKRD